MRKALVMAVAFLAIPAQSVWAASTFSVQPVLVSDEKAVFATVESRDVVPARVRTGGTIESLSVREGDEVTAGQVIATIGDPKLLLQKGSLEAQIAALKAQRGEAESDLGRAQTLFKGGVTTRARLDEATTAANVAANMLKARIAERSVLDQQMAEGDVLAPTAGRVLTVPVTVGTVATTGETIATVAQHDFILRLSVPEHDARILETGAPLRLDVGDLGQGAAATGTISLVYPLIRDGRVTVDARVAGLGDYFVGERVLVWISAGRRRTYIVPARFIATRFGLDYARLRQPDGTVVDVPVQRGRDQPQPNMPDALEILSGLHPGDVLV